MNITVIRQPNEQIQVINLGFSYKKINENIAAIIGTRLIIINALATSVLAKAKIKVIFDPTISKELMIPGFPIFLKSGIAFSLKKIK